MFKLNKLSRFQAVVSLFVLYLLLQNIMRIVNLISVSGDIPFDIFAFIKMFLIGFIFDLTAFSHLIIPFSLFLLFSPQRWFEKKWFKGLTFALCVCFVYLLGFTKISEWLFWVEFSSSFNFIAVDYLVYTTEVVGNMWQSYPIVWIFSGIFIFSFALVFFFRKLLVPQSALSISGKERIIGFVAIIGFPILTFFAVDQEYREWSSDNSYIVETTGNGVYDLFSAYRNNELNYNQFYPTIDNKDALNHVKKSLKTKEATFLNDDWRDVSRFIKNEGEEKKPHIVFIAVESLSADYMKFFGNKDDRTPFLDSLIDQSLFFTRAYATGTRSVRGLEAYTLCVPPTPGQAMVRRPHNDHLFSVGSILRNKGYRTQWLYGGLGYFDNMNQFFSANGYEIFDRRNIPKEDIVFENIWGVADEVLYDQAIKKLDVAHEKGEKLFQFFLTTTNHRPFTYPDERIDIPSPGGRKGAVKYTDWAIGEFINKAKTKPWFKDTMFVITADHQASSAGKTDLPIQRYHIPVLVYYPEVIKPGRIDKLMSQIDVVPTVLGLLNMSYTSKFLGIDVLKTNDDLDNRVFISTYQSLGYVKSDYIVILTPKRGVKTYKILNFKKGEYEEVDDIDQFTDEAVSWYQSAGYLLKHNLYKEIEGQK